MFIIFINIGGTCMYTYYLYLHFFASRNVSFMTVLKAVSKYSIKLWQKPITQKHITPIQCWGFSANQSSFWLWLIVQWQIQTLNYGERGGVCFFACPAGISSLCEFSTQNKGGRPPGSFPRSVTVATQ